MILDSWEPKLLAPPIFDGLLPATIIVNPSRFKKCCTAEFSYSNAKLLLSDETKGPEVNRRNLHPKDGLIKVVK